MPKGCQCAPTVWIQLLQHCKEALNQQLATAASSDPSLAASRAQLLESLAELDTYETSAAGIAAQAAAEARKRFWTDAVAREATEARRRTEDAARLAAAQLARDEALNTARLAARLKAQEQQAELEAGRQVPAKPLPAGIETEAKTGVVPAQAAAANGLMAGVLDKKQTAERAAAAATAAAGGAAPAADAAAAVGGAGNTPEGEQAAKFMQGRKQGD